MPQKSIPIGSYGAQNIDLSVLFDTASKTIVSITATFAQATGSLTYTITEIATGTVLFSHTFTGTETVPIGASISWSEGQGKTSVRSLATEAVWSSV